MLAIGIRYLCGRAVATHPTDRASPEWPPHPDRVFMALAAAYFETGQESGEGAALEWLEGLPTPALSASENASVRTPVTSFVPVNDEASPISKKQKPQMISGTLPIGRGRQPRGFPTVTPESDTVYVIWQAVEAPAEIGRALESLCNKVTYLGHSSSPVQMWVEAAPPEPNLIPVEGRATCRLRVSGHGRLATLAASYEAGQRPPLSLWSGYARPAPEAPMGIVRQTVFDDQLIVLRRIAGTELPLEATLTLTEALRGAVMSACGQQPPPEWISGHRADNARSENDHLAFLPLPFVGREYADGHLLGAALVVPRHVPAADVARCLAVFLAPETTGEMRLTMGTVGEWVMALEERLTPPEALQTKTWIRPHTRWATVTPIVLDRYTKAKDAAEAEAEAQATIAAACERIGLPRPVEVVLMSVSLLAGAPPAGAFAPLPAKFNKTRRLHTHALLTFAEPVRGPVLLGAGRYRGYGLCRPYEAWKEMAL